jgi:hypothetical protein
VVILLALCHALLATTSTNGPRRRKFWGPPLSTDFYFLWLGLLALGALGGLFASAVNPASAGEAAYCLACTGPDQIYLCRVTGEGARQNEVFKLYCIARTARKGRHASCAAAGSPENCHGKLKSYKYRGPSIPAALAENPRVKRFISEAEQDYRSTPEVTAATPLSDLPKENAKSSRWSMFHGVTRAGAAMGSFARSSYKCLRSLFRNCSRKTQE